MLGRIWVFTTRGTFALRLSGFDLLCWHGVPRIPREEMYFFFIFWRDIYQKTVRYPLSFPRSEGHQNDKKSSKKAQKRLQNWHFLAFSGCFFSHGDLGQYSFLVFWPGRSIGIIIGMKKKSFEIFVKIIIFFWSICLKSLPCAVNGFESLLDGASRLRKVNFSFPTIIWTI